MFFKIKKIFLCIFLFSIFSLGVTEERAVSEKTKLTVKKAVEGWLDSRYKVNSIRTTPLENIVEVRVGNELIYVDKSGSFIFVEGQMISLKSGENLTEIRKQEIFKINFSSLPLDLSIKNQFGKIKRSSNRVIAIFEDPYCSYCRKFRATLNEMEDLTVYTFLYPILGEKSVKTSERILCSKDPSKALENLMIDGIKPGKLNKVCDASIEKLLKLGKEYGVEATPTIYLSNGIRISGAISKEILNKELNKIK